VQSGDGGAVHSGAGRVPQNGKPLYFVYQEANGDKWRARFEQLIEQGRMRPEMSPALAQEVFSDLLYGAVFSQLLAGDRESRAARGQMRLSVSFLRHPAAAVLNPSYEPPTRQVLVLKRLSLLEMKS